MFAHKMKKPGLHREAIQNLKGSSLEHYSESNDGLSFLEGWTYIGMFLVEAKTSLKLFTDFNRKDKFTEMDEIVFYQSLFKNFVLSYAKCFSSSGKGRLSLDANDVYSSQQDLKKIHEEIMEIRNKYVAHNDDSDFNISIALTSETDRELTLAQTYTIMTPVNRIKKYLEVVEFCESQVVVKFNKMVDKIEIKIGKKIIFTQGSEH